MGSVPEPRGSVIEPCRLFPFCRSESCKFAYYGPSVVTVHVPDKSLSLEDEAGDVLREGRSGGASLAGPSDPPVLNLAGAVDAGAVEIVTSSGFSNLNNNCVSELMRSWSGLVSTAPPPPPAPAPITAPFVPPRMPPRTPPTAAPIPMLRAAFLPSDEPVSVNSLLVTVYDCLP